MVDRISRHQHQKLPQNVDREFDPKSCFRDKNLKFVLLMVDRISRCS